jgi:hypothetical protein
MNFEELLLEAIDEGFSTLGESSKAAIYFKLEKTFKIKRQEIPHRIEEFTDAIERIFGTGAQLVEIRIMRFLFTRVGCTFKSYQSPANLDFTEYIAAIKLAKNNDDLIKNQQPNSNRKRNNKRIVFARMS